MGRPFGILLLVAVALVDCGTAAVGATLTTTVSVGATYDLAGNLQSSTGLINDGAPHILRFDFFSQVSGLSPSQSYGAEEFNITLSGSLSRNSITVVGPGLTTPKPNFVVNNPPLSNIASGLSFAPIPSYFAGGAQMMAEYRRQTWWRSSSSFSTTILAIRLMPRPLRPCPIPGERLV